MTNADVNPMRGDAPSKAIETEAALAMLEAWLGLSLSIRANRVLEELTFNQMAVCHLLYADRANGGTGMSAAELCTATSLLKSQMNKELASLEEKGLILKEPDEQDRRKVVISLNDANEGIYLAEHERIMVVFEGLVAEYGADRLLGLAEGLREATEIAERIIEG